MNFLLNQGVNANTTTYLFFLKDLNQEIRPI
jgi:hypothetical protein